MHHSYHPMQGGAWQHISADAMNLVQCMLTKDPVARISIEEILQHPWLRTTAVGNFGNAYMNRIKNLALRNKLRVVFGAHQIEDEHRYLKETFQNLLPFLQHPSISDVSILHDAVQSEEFTRRLLTLKELLVTAIYDKSNQDVVVTDAMSPSICDDRDDNQRTKRRRLVHDGHIDFDSFCSLVSAAELQVLATPEVFSIFDTNGDGSVDMKEFLITLLALKPTCSEEDQIEAAELYFRMFDVDEDGSIGQNELELVVNCLLHDGTGPLLVTSDREVNTHNVEDLFRAIDTDNDGRIDFPEFKKFFQTILATTTTQLSQTNSMEEASEADAAASQRQFVAIVPETVASGGTFSFL